MVYHLKINKINMSNYYPAFLKNKISKVPETLLEKLGIDTENENTWAGMLGGNEASSWFKVKYYGKLYENRIVAADAPPLLVAENADTKEDVLIFEGVRHGYDSVIACFNREFLGTERAASEVYTNSSGESEFQIVLVANYDFEADGEELNEEYTDALDFAKALGINTMEELLGNSFVYFTIYVISKTGIIEKILEEELA
jgi:hypothetical protein